MKRAPRQLSLLTPPTWSTNEVLSAFVKCVRLRYETDALKYLRILWDSGPTEQRRVQRRILISSAEDGMSISVMRAVSDWYNSGRRYQFESAAREVLRICKTQNWYETQIGRDYMFAWRFAELAGSITGGNTLAGSFYLMSQALENADLPQLLRAFYGLYEHPNFNTYALSDFLTREAVQRSEQGTCVLAEIYADNARHIFRDTNFSGQCVYFLFNGEYAQQEDPHLTEGEVAQYCAIAKSLARKDWDVPGWALDGIHCKGSDPRFAGELKHMVAACNAYDHYGRLSPEDNWLPEFYLQVADHCASERV